jgi:hypothetical protein
VLRMLSAASPRSNTAAIASRRDKCGRGRRRAPAVRAAYLSLSAVALLFVSATARAQQCFQDSDCADGNVCNGIERCLASVCAPSAPIPCDDGDPCTLDACDPTIGCSHAEELCPADCTGLPDGMRCVDGTVCTIGDTCEEGSCVPGPAPLCPDADSCTAASCDAVFGCVYVEQAVSPPCVAQCTGTVADFTRCTADANVCTIDACLPSVLFGQDECIKGLLFPQRQCNDDDVCNGEEWCSPVLGCQSGPPLACDDGDACNGSETCDAQTGCAAGTPLPDGSACDDHLDCTAADTCAAHACAGIPVLAADCDDADAGTTDECREGFGCLNCKALALRSVNVKFTRTGRQSGKIKVGGALVLQGATVSPDVEAFTMVLDLDGDESYRASLPPGSVSVIADGKHTYASKAPVAAANGLRSLRLTSKGSDIVIKTSSAALDIAGPHAASGNVIVVIGDDCFRSAFACESAGNGKGLRCRL